MKIFAKNKGCARPDKTINHLRTKATATDIGILWEVVGEDGSLTLEAINVARKTFKFGVKLSY